MKTIFTVLLVALLIFRLSTVKCQLSNDTTNDNDPTVLAFFTHLAYSKVNNLTTGIINGEISNNAKFCIKDRDVEWNQTFDFSSDLSFLSSCIKKTGGDITKRICTAAEINFYFGNSLRSGLASSNYLKPNINCNLTSWATGCEPGWACSVSPSVDVQFNNSKEIPDRKLDCQSCCEGFFCPHGITCMIPCPLGSYCPLATFNPSSGVCEPYNYQLPPAMPDHTCGGANIWADIDSSREVFCSPGSYCPTNIQKLSCSSGHYCRTGSVAERSCFKLSSCDSHTENQNIHAYGVLLIAGLVTLLLIIYNCSDQVIITRERRHAKTREAAAKSVREKVIAREKWKSAKDVAKKHAHQLTQTFSRKKIKPPERLNRPNQTKVGTDDDLDSSIYPSTSISFNLPYAPGGNNREKSGIIEQMQQIEDEPDSSLGYSFDVENNVARKVPKNKQINTNSQIFKYAYSQLEKEKAQQQKNQNLTFSGVVAMATNPETIKRPPIEVSFRGLTITLKGKNKHLLRCVTGKLKPGRVTSVMGPSGAGKTTFLSAIAGKTHGHKISGLILINGVNESIHSYRKIIGFVPQDDIVHGNLTVEENFWFSARSRLAADLQKPDKVLIVERVIQSLGLQSVRNSLVGTVEKRGISGGQRKRVNVGLELVMEPSLLILDEPTSGLDSTSSQLLLRALRREALEGVNICMVVHQPSYSLFKMFDDLIILAKGGLTVYHGPVKKVEEYFAGLGINVPDRVNPPDHFIDVLEGIVKPSTTSSISHTELPVRWMLHNGYPIPTDMRKSYAGLAALSSGDGRGSHMDFLSGDGVEDQSFAGEIWQDMMCNMEIRRDIIRHNFLRPRDLSQRRTPGILMQYKYFLGRIGKQRLREARIIAIDYLILLLAGACLGSLTKTSDNKFGALGYTHTIIAVSLLCKIAALRSFSLDKLQYWRESASGISSLAHFLAKDSVDHFNTVIKPLVYLSMFYFFSNPRSSFSDNYIVLMCLVYCVTGIGYVLAIFLEPGPSQLCAVLMPVVLTLVATQTVGNKYTKMLSNFCYPKWALEAFVISNAERFSGVWLITRCGVLNALGFDVRDWSRCIIFLIVAGLISRIAAFVGMITFRKKFSGVWLITRCGVLNALGFDVRDWSRCIIFLIVAGLISRIAAFVGMITFRKK